MADSRFDYAPEPDDRAVAYLRAKGLRRSWRWASLWHQEHAFGFTLAGVWRLDVLDAAQRLVTEAVERGETLEGFKKRFRSEMERLGFAGPQTVSEFAEGPRQVNLTASWRVRTIYDTNVRNAYAAAEWQAIQDTKADFPALEYLGVDDEATRVSHERWFGVVLPVDHIFWRWYFPPNDWGCRCYTIQISLGQLARGEYRITTEEELAARGFRADPADWDEWTDKRTGRVAMIPPGVGPAFAYNAGMARREAVADLLARKLEGLTPDMARAAAADLVNLPQFRDLVQDAVATGLARAAATKAARDRLLAQGAGKEAAKAAAGRARDAIGFGRESFPVGVMPAELEAIDAAAGRLVVVNPSAIGHSADIHPTRPEDWRRLQLLLERGEVWAAGDGTLSVLGVFRIGSEERTWALVLKPLDGAWRVRTLFPTSPRRRARLTQGARRLRHGRETIELG